MNSALINSLIAKYSKFNSVPIELLRAICQTESGMNPYAARFEPSWNYFEGHEAKAKEVCASIATMRMMYATSFGLCQIMGAVYYDLGGKDFATELIDPDTNLLYATKILKNILKKYSEPHEIYAVYNAGALKFKKNGELINQANVDRFKAIYSKRL